MDCGVCFSNFNKNERLPLTYTCGHSYCLTCVEGYHRNGCYKCPTCRQTQNMTPVKNYGLIDMLDIYSVLEGINDKPELARQMNELINESVINKQKLATFEEKQEFIEEEKQKMIEQFAEKTKKMEEEKQNMMEQFAENTKKKEEEKQKLKADLKVQTNERRWAEESSDIECRRKHAVIEESRDIKCRQTNKIIHLENELKIVKDRKDMMDHWVGSIANEEYYVMIDGEYIKKDLKRQYQATYALVHAPEWAYEDSGQPGYDEYRDGKMRTIKDGMFLDGKYTPIITSTTEDGKMYINFMVY